MCSGKAEVFAQTKTKTKPTNTEVCFWNNVKGYFRRCECIQAYLPREIQHRARAPGEGRGWWVQVWRMQKKKQQSWLQPFTFPPGSCLAALWAAANRLHAVLPAFRIYRGPEKHSYRFSLKHTFKSPLLFSLVFALESQNCMNVTHLQQFMSSIFQLLWCYTEICKQPRYEFQHKWLTVLCMCTYSLMTS